MRQVPYADGTLSRELEDDDAPATMGELIQGMGWFARFRWWLFKRLSALGYAVCPQPMKRHMQVLWDAKLGEFMKAAEALSEGGEA